MSKKINIDFYKISMPNSATTPFEAVLQQVVQLPIQDRFKDVSQYPICLYQVESVWQQCWEGEIMRLRMDNLPVKGSLSGNIEAFVFKDDEGIGEQTAFLYHPQTRVLLLQSNKSGVSSPTFIKYFEMMSSPDESIYIDPVIQPEALERLASVKNINKFELHVAGLDNMRIFQNQDYSIKEILKLSEEFHSPVINLNLSTGRKKQDSLSLDKIKNTAMEWLRISSQNKEVKKIRISGSTEENERIYIDLLKDRMRESVDLKKTGTSRTISYHERRQAVRESWQCREKELRKMFE